MKTLLSLLGAVALLVWGTHIVRTGLLRVYGANLRGVLASSVRNRGVALTAGVGVTTLLQSSTATTLIASSFVGQGLIATAPALATISYSSLAVVLLTATLAGSHERELAFADTHLQRLSWNTPESIATSSLHLDLISEMKRINSHLCSVAYPILESAGVLSRSRVNPELVVPLPTRRRASPVQGVNQSPTKVTPANLPKPQP